MKHILKCIKCNKYTMKQICNCGSKTVDVRPPKYSPEDKYAKYRRETKYQELIEKNII